MTEHEADPVVFAVPEAYRNLVPGRERTVSFCPRTLVLAPATDPPEKSAFDRLPEAFPTDTEAVVPMALLVGLLDELALYRSEITTLLEAVERAGVDPLLVLSRLAADPTVDAAVDLDARGHQIEQLL